MDKYIGRIINIIYLDRNGQFSQRRIRVISVKDDLVQAHDYTRQAPRVFRRENILAVQPVAKTA